MFLIPIFSIGQNVTIPAASPASEVSQTIGISTVTVHYSRPAVKTGKFGVRLFLMDGTNNSLEKEMKRRGGQVPIKIQPLVFHTM